MAVMAEALRDKARQEQQEYKDRRAQAEAERPEVVGQLITWPTGQQYVGRVRERKRCETEDVMTVAQHERIAASRWERAMDLMGEHVARISEKLTKERDAALARVAELEKGTVYVEARQCDECQHGGINDSADGLAACHDCDWTGPEPDEDKCPGCHRENCMTAACPACGGRYVLVASDDVTAPVAQAQHSVPEGFIGRLSEFLAQRGATGKALLRELRDMLAAAPARGQHSVPAYVSYTTRPAESLAGIALRQLKDESRWVEIRDINAHAFPDMQSHSYYPAGTVIKLPAAAPGKEVPQAWLDVQAERRRQIEAEGWTPEHDDEHSHGQMARAAACYALAGSSAPNDGTAALLVSLAWPWDEQWWKPTSARRDLIKACALTLAEIERLDRAGISQNPQPGATTASS